VRAQDAEALWALVNESKMVVEFHVQRGRAAGVSTAQLARDLLNTAALIASRIERETFVQQIALHTGLSTNTLLEELAQQRRPQQRSAPNVAQRAVWPPKGVTTLLATSLIRSPEIRATIFQQWSPEQVPDERLKKLLIYVQDATQTHRYPDVTSLLSAFPEPPERDYLAACEGDDELEDEKRVLIDRKTALDWLNALQIENVRQQINDLKQRIRLTPDDPELSKTLLDLIAREKALRAAAHDT
jgi:hypothetical protein